MGKIDTCMSFCDAKATIEKLSDRFDSHQFIDIYRENYTISYQDLRSRYEHAVDAHVLIGKYLSKYRNELGIDSAGRSVSTNVYGRKNECELWRKIK